MDIVRLRADEAARLREAPLTYAEVGRTHRSDPLPHGYHQLARSSVVGRGEPLFEQVAREVMSWQIQLRAGVGVRAEGDRVEQGGVAELYLGCGRLAIKAPVRVVDVIDEAGRRGFAYGTLPGHPESGEESFLVARDAEGVVRLEIRAFSRPASLLTRAGGPLARAVQSLVTTRYLRSATVQ